MWITLMACELHFDFCSEFGFDPESGETVYTSARLALDHGGRS